MAEHVAWVRRKDLYRLRKWMEAPNGSFTVDNSRVTFEAVEDGGILVRTRDWQHGDN